MSENDSGQPQELNPQLPEKLTVQENILEFPASPEAKAEAKIYYLENAENIRKSYDKSVEEGENPSDEEKELVEELKNGIRGIQEMSDDDFWKMTESFWVDEINRSQEAAKNTDILEHTRNLQSKGVSYLKKAGPWAILGDGFSSEEQFLNRNKSQNGDVNEPESMELIEEDSAESSLASEQYTESTVKPEIEAEEKLGGKKNFPETGVNEAPSVVKEKTPEQLFEEYIQARIALDEAAKNGPVILSKAGEKKGPTEHEKEIKKKFEERVISKEEKERTVLGLLEEIFDNGVVLENRVELKINAKNKNDAIEKTLKEKSYISLDDLEILDFLLDSNSGVEIKGMPKGPKEKELRDKLNEFVVLQRHLVHLAGEIPMVNLEKRKKELSIEIKKLHEKRINLYGEILQHADEFSGRNEIRERVRPKPESAAEKIETPQGHAVEYLDEMFGKIGEDGKVEKVGMIEEALKKGKDVYVELKPQAIGKLLEQTLDIQTPDGVKVDVFSIRQEFELKEEKKRIKLSFNASVKKDRKVLGIKVPGVSWGMNGEMIIGEAPEDLPNSNIAISEVKTNPAKVYGKDTKNLFESYLGGEGLENSNDSYFKTRIKEGIDSIVYTMTDEGNLRVDFKAKKIEVGSTQVSSSVLTPPELREPVAGEEQQKPVEVPEITSVSTEEFGKELIENTSESAEIGRKKLTPIDYILDADPKDVFVYRLTGKLEGKPTQDYVIFQLQKRKDKPGLLHISILTPVENNFVKKDSVEIEDLEGIEEIVKGLVEKMPSDIESKGWQTFEGADLDDIREQLEEISTLMKKEPEKSGSRETKDKVMERIETAVQEENKSGEKYESENKNTPSARILEPIWNVLKKYYSSEEKLVTDLQSMYEAAAKRAQDILIERKGKVDESIAFGKAVEEFIYPRLNKDLQRGIETAEQREKERQYSVQGIKQGERGGMSMTASPRKMLTELLRLLK